MAAPPMMPPMESSESFNPEFNMAGTPPKEGAPALASPMEDAAPAWPEQRTGPPDAQTQQRVHDVLYSDIGVATLLNRLKASIASARDFANFLKRRGALEEEHAGSLKKLSRLTLDGVRKPDTRHESYQTQFEQVLHANERIADNGTQFGLALHAMHENLLQMANKMEANRKTWKQQGLTAENKVQDAERLAEKAKAKYDQLAEDLDRVKTGDTGAGRKFGLKGPKSAAQHEEDLQRKTQAADQDYASKVQTAQTSRKELVATTRPQAVAALLDLIKETDAALTMEMQKYASFNEKLVVNNGQVVSPQPLKGSTSQLSPSINQLIYQINNERDFDEYILSHASKAPLSKAELQYVKHPTQAPTRSHPTPPAALKALFDSDASQVDFRNPETFQQDVNSVAGLLKQFFRELPDPLLTREFYSKYIDAARIDDETMRRDSMHALINALPDPNYATLRALVLHLHRVQQSSEVNRMSTANLGICWAPSIMGPHKGNNMADAGLQARVVITILDNVLQIFDED
ncbi:beta-chimaerin [Pyrenophora tritici-repentis Pt-1C-BFP]|uniref:Beta-chimaerin n=1 Tax=Pyrenophora tritici-repentis (strain Pt-1C-BFP) TaxID=426418 RepID=B2WAM7_PYRTR|nr:beta-chimaerin [Pyrenophora tritici-repentis Pt-1C-BFP]EDU50259.1 beta-chimaerin [Pyrenophora tritici-repentis Pt-1C-BFP]